MRCHRDLFHGHVNGQCSDQTFPTFFFFLQKGKSIFYCRKETEFAGGSSKSLQILTSLLLWNKKPPQTGKLFLAKIMSISGTGNTLHFFFISTLVLSKPFPIFSIPKSVNWTHWALKYLYKKKCILFQS